MRREELLKIDFGSEGNGREGKGWGRRREEKGKLCL